MGHFSVRQGFPGGYSACVCHISELWILGGKLSPKPRVMEAPETGYPELVLVQILLHLIRGLPHSVCLVPETGGEVTLGGLGDVLTSRLDMELPISLDDGGKLPLYVLGR